MMYRINKLIIWVLHEGKHGLNIILPLFLIMYTENG